MRWAANIFHRFPCAQWSTRCEADIQIAIFSSTVRQLKDRPMRAFLLNWPISSCSSLVADATPLARSKKLLPISIQTNSQASYLTSCPEIGNVGRFAVHTKRIWIVALFVFVASGHAQAVRFDYSAELGFL